MSGSTLFDQAQAVATIDKQAGIYMFQKIIGTEVGDFKNEEQLQLKERSILELGQLYSGTNRANELGNLIKAIRPFLHCISKVKAAKLVKTLIDLFLDLKADPSVEIEVCEECIEWAKTEKRVYLRRELEVKLMTLLCNYQYYTKALLLGQTLLKELKKVEEKNLLIEIYLLETKAYYSLENLYKAKASLTLARIIATTMYCQPKVQAELDLQSGVLQAAVERDFNTAYSYFLEALESFDLCNCPRALDALKYMLLCKIMLNTPEDIQNILMRNVALKYIGREIEAMKEIAKAISHNSLTEFEIMIARYKKEIVNDPVMRMHLEALCDIMFERSITKIVLPYSRVQIKFISDKIGLDKNKVEKKLSQMILDKKVQGILDQECGVFIVRDQLPPCQSYEAGLEMVKYLGKLVDTLYTQATKI